MSTKRKHSESEAIHPSRQAQVPGALPQPSKKPRRTVPPTHKKPESHTSVNAIKKRLRDVKRRLERSENLPATIRVEDERALAAYQQELAAANEEKERQKMIKKYHMVRFFGVFHFSIVIIHKAYSIQSAKKLHGT
jgi:predicted  nucleic acid-binding Zn-ribbon protein